jgi:hypothetical protein
VHGKVRFAALFFLSNMVSNLSHLKKFCEILILFLNIGSPGFYCPDGLTVTMCPPGKYCNSSGLLSPSGSCAGGYYCPGAAMNAFGVSPITPGLFVVLDPQKVVPPLFS